MASKIQRYISPKGTAKYPWLNKPSTAFSKVEYKVTLLLPAEEKSTQDFLEQMDALVQESYEKAVEDLQSKKKPAEAKSVKKKVPYKAELDKETGEETGNIELTFTMPATTKDGKPRSPKLFDAKGKGIDASRVNVGGGSLIKVSFSVGTNGDDRAGYYMPSTKEAGIKLYLNAVQIIKLEEWSSGSASSFGFEEDEEGYSYEESTGSEFSETAGDVQEDF